MNAAFISYFIKYIDASGKTVERKIIPSDFGVTEIDPNYYAFYLASKFNNKEDLISYLLDSTWKYNLRNHIETSGYEKRYRNSFIPSKVLSFALIINKRYAYHSGNSVFNSDGVERNKKIQDSISIPIMYADSYKDRQDEKAIGDTYEYQILSTEDLKRPYEAFRKIINNLLSRSYLDPRDAEFYQTILFYLGDFVEDLLNRLKNDIEVSEKNEKIKEHKKRRIDEILEIKDKDPKSFIRKAINGEDKGILLTGSASDDSLKFYVFMANFIAQLKANEVAKAIDAIGLYNQSFRRVGSRYNESNYVYRSLLINSTSQTYKVFYDNAYMAAYYEQRRNEESEQERMTRELVDEYMVRYPGLSEQDIIDIFIKPDDFSR